MAGATFACDLTSGPANGVAVIGLALGLSSQVAVPAFGGTLLVAASVLSTVVLDPAGAVTLPIVAPPSPSLRGLNVNAQGAVLDVGAPQSIALTAAIEFWLG